MILLVFITLYLLVCDSGLSLVVVSLFVPWCLSSAFNRCVCRFTTCLTAGFTEDDALTMMAKINFFATQVEDHDNVIKFIGAVTDNQGCK